MSSCGQTNPSPCEFNTDKLTLRIDELVASDVEGISPVVDKLMSIINESDCAPKESFGVEIALREALANAVTHGNRQNPQKKVRVCCACQQDRGLLIIVKDEGEGFDPSTVPSPLVGKNLYAAHGRGIFLINQMMDAVEFRKGGTEIHMRKS
jgi:serine/threonine-protein kinase RsbW